MYDRCLIIADSPLDAQTLAMVLWAGLATITVALVVLGRTRWGQAKPLSKCVVLSLFAHVLFGTYAYTTRMLVGEAPQPKQETIRLSIIDPHDTRRSTPPDQDDAKPWEQLAAEVNLSPNIDGPPRQSTVQDISAEPPKLENLPSLTSSATDVANLPIPEIEPPELIPAPAITAVTAAPAPTPTPPNELEPIAPSPVENTPSPEDVANNLQPDPTHSPVVEPGTSVQQLDNLPQSEDANSLQGSDNNLAAADGGGQLENLTPDQSQANAVETQPYVAHMSDQAPAQPDPAQNAIPTRAGDAAPLPQAYALRVAPDRLNLIKQFGGSAQTEESVNAALRWLARNQSEDGRWRASQFGAGRETKAFGHDRDGAGQNSDTAMTGLALLAFLGAGHSHLEGDYRDNVYHGLRFLIESQAQDGNLYGNAKLFAKMYCHGIATLAISEAYALTGDYRLKASVDGAISHTIGSQDRNTGGWRYQPGDAGDMSQFGWQLMALKSAEYGGIPTPAEARVGMLRFLTSVSAGQHRGLASYRPRQNNPSETMTAEAMACRQFMGMRVSPLARTEAQAFLARQMPDSKRVNLYYWYYGTLALFPQQDEMWRAWNTNLKTQLLSLQIKEGQQAGSWGTETVWGSYGGQVYTTAMATLCLEVYYRYLPLYQ